MNLFVIYIKVTWLLHVEQNHEVQYLTAQKSYSLVGRYFIDKQYITEVCQS